MARPNRRRDLLDAAAGLILAHGTSALTFDRLASVTGVSKGGLLYHFPTKADLLRDLLDQTLQHFEDTVTERATDGDPRAWARAYVDATFDLEVSRPDVAFAVLLASADTEPELLRRCAERFDTWEARLRAEGLEPGLTATIRYACDGWWTVRAVGAGPQGDDGIVLRDHLRRLLEASGPGEAEDT